MPIPREDDVFIATLPKGVGVSGYLRRVRVPRAGAVSDAKILSVR